MIFFHVFDETGNPRKTGQLISTFSGEGSGAGRRQLIGELSKMNNRTAQVIKDMEKYHSRLAFKKAFKSTLPWLAGLAGGGLAYELGRVAQHASP